MTWIVDEEHWHCWHICTAPVLNSVNNLRIKAEIKNSVFGLKLKQIYSQPRCWIVEFSGSALVMRSAGGGSAPVLRSAGGGSASVMRGAGGVMQSDAGWRAAVRISPEI